MNKRIGNNPLGELVKIIRELRRDDLSPWNKFVTILKEVWLGFKIAEANRHKSGFGKF